MPALRVPGTHPQPLAAGRSARRAQHRGDSPSSVTRIQVVESGTARTGWIPRPVVGARQKCPRHHLEAVGLGEKPYSGTAARPRRPTDAWVSAPYPSRVRSSVPPASGEGVCRRFVADAPARHYPRRERLTNGSHPADVCRRVRGGTSRGASLGPGLGGLQGTWKAFMLMTEVPGGGPSAPSNPQGGPRRGPCPAEQYSHITPGYHMNKNMLDHPGERRRQCHKELVRELVTGSF
ncbi:hypothetical protein SPURM210S_03915 [Streptomyces purpurascens]